MAKKMPMKKGKHKMPGGMMMSDEDMPMMEKGKAPPFKKGKAKSKKKGKK